MGDGATGNSDQTALRLTRRTVLLTAAALPLAGCWGSTYEWRQKLTLIVITPQGDVKGSAVTSVKWFDAGPQYKNNMAGEAVVIDLGQGKILFALLNSPKGDDSYHMSLSLPSLLVNGKTTIDVGKTRGEHFDEIRASKGAMSVPFKQCPMLVTFDDLNDPKSVKQVEPANLAATFGAGYALKSVTLEIVDEPVTAGEVEKVLGWIWDYTARYVPEEIRKVKKGDPLNGVGGGDLIQPFRRPELK